MNNASKTALKVALPALLFAVILGYTYYKTRDLLRGVVLNVSGIADGQSVSDPLVTLSGSARNAADISVDDRKIFIDKSANFNEKLVLLPGYNIVTIKAEDKFGKKVQRNYQLTLK